MVGKSEVSMMKVEPVNFSRFIIQRSYFIVSILLISVS